MDFDEAKENIKPLASGRNVSILHASLRTDVQELLEQRRQYENEINNYHGEDPLDPWYTYISWIEQSCPSGGKESGLHEVLVKCLTRFENESKYYQDERMVKLYIKFINGLKDPMEKYEALSKAGIGTMVADFYISWAYVADLCGNARKADQIFLHGIKCHAQPKEVLEEAHQHFRFYVSQRLMYKDDDEVLGEANRQLQERRLALTSLHKHGRKATVGSIRTGVAIKSHEPGTVHLGAVSKRKDNALPKVYCDENLNPSTSSVETATPVVTEDNVSAVRMLIDAARDLENEREPGPWNKAHNTKKHSSKIFGKKAKAKNLEFDIHEDMDIDEDSLPANSMLPTIPIGPFKYPPNFVSKNNPQAEWVLPVTTEEQPEPRCYPHYNKCLLYPRPNKEFQLEELLVYKLFKKRGIRNSFTAARDAYWSVGDVKAPCRLYPNFAKKNLPQPKDRLDEYCEPLALKGLVVSFGQIYNSKLREEFQCEELLWQKRLVKSKDTRYVDDPMDETVCATSERVKSRKSFFPTRQSIMPAKVQSNQTPIQVGLAEGGSLMEKLLAKEVINTDVLPPQPKQEAIVSGDGGSLMARLLALPKKTTIDEPEKEEPNTNSVGLGFEIYEDTTRPKVLAHIPAAKQESRVANDFAFKAPLVPLVAQPPVVKTNNYKLSFEVYKEQDENNSPQPQSGGYFEGDETLSTQQFNIFLKTQDKVSTPNMPHKVAPRFALKPMPMPIMTEQLLAPDEIEHDKENIIEVVVQQSAGNTEDPHPLAESTVDGEKIGTQGEANKLDDNSPQQYFKNLSTILETSEHGSSQMTAASRTTTKSSCVSSPEQETNGKLLTELETVLEQPSREQSINQSLTAPTITTNKNNTNNADNNNKDNTKNEMPDMCRFVNQSDVMDKGAGNFMRLKQHEETAHLSVNFMGFQEDKTETLPMKLKTTSKFQEDETETFSKILAQPSRTGVIASGCGGGFQEDKTETFSKLIAPPNFPCLSKTPEKSQMAQSLSCYNTPELKLSPFGKLDKDKHNNNNSTRNPNSTANLLLKDSMLQLSESPLPQVPLAVSTALTTPKLKFRDSFIPDFSFIIETQGATAATNTTDMAKVLEESTIPQLTKTKQNTNSEESIITATQGLSLAHDSMRAKQQGTRAIASNDSLNGISRSDMRWMQNKQNTSQPAELDASSTKNNQNRHMLPDIFIQDFSAVNMLPPNSSNNNKSTSNFMSNTSKYSGVSKATIQFMDESKTSNALNKSHKSMKKDKKQEKPTISSHGNEKRTLKFLDDFKTPNKSPKSNDNYFEGNIETSLFAVNNSMIKNSTRLPTSQLSPKTPQAVPQPKIMQPTYINENSIHIKEEPMGHNSDASIYYNKSPKETRHIWDENVKTPKDNQYVHAVVDLNSTHQVIQGECANEHVNPFATALTNAFLEEIAFTEYAGSLPTCQLQRHLSRLKTDNMVQVHEDKFEILKFIGEGAYGSIYKGKHVQSGKHVALKQEQPPNCWEYYICLEIQSRIKCDDMLTAYMSVDWALIGKNSSILISSFSPYGSLIQVCNKIHKHTNKHVDEYVVMHIVRELLEIIDHLHAINIIHADIKPDNFLLINPLSYKNETRALQLIDFGVSIDMKLFNNPRQTFTFVHKQDAFNCVEMREGRPWTYQLDFYGLASVIHVLLFGKYMEITQRDNRLWMPKTHIPRYYQQTLWKNIFEKLLNVEDCHTMPDLQVLRKELKEVLVDHEHHAIQKLADFNYIMRT